MALSLDGALLLDGSVFLCPASCLPYSSHPPPGRWLAREVPALGQGDRSNDDPQHGGPYEVPRPEGHPCYPNRRGDYPVRDDTRVHEHRHQQAPISTLVDPHHEHPVGGQEGEEDRGHEEGEGDPGGGAASPDIREEVPRAPQEPHEEPGSEDAVAPQEPGYGEPCPS